MRASLGICLILVACGSRPPPPAPAVVAKPPPPPAADCTDVGVILRGELELVDAEGARARELAIEGACRDDAWPKPVIDCVASTPRPQDCLAKLDGPRRAGYDKRLAAWSQVYEASGGTGTAMRTLVDCHDLLGDVAPYPPVLDDSAPERAWQHAARRGVLDEECDHEWNDELKDCLLAAAGATAQIEACFEKDLLEKNRQHLAGELAEISALATKLAAAKQKPASVTCAKVVAAHYADAQWKQKLDGFKPAERKRMIAASRDAMTKACTNDKWDDTQRACIVVGGGDVCFAGTHKRRWGYPATGTVTVVGIAECDEYSAAVMKLTTCNMLPQSSRDSIVRSQQQMLAEIARVPAAERVKMASSCKAGLEAIASSLSAAGC